MIANPIRSRLPLAALTATLMTLAGTGAVAQAASAPVKEVLLSHIGWEVDMASKGNICTVASEEVCQPGRQSSEPGGFAGPRGVAVQTDPASARPGDIYVADSTNNRVQELTAGGGFVSTFGVKGSAAGQLFNPVSVAVDPAAGNVYVAEEGNSRVDEYTPDGAFVWMAGREVNKTKDTTPGASETERNLCTAASLDVCTGGAQAPVGSTEHDAFHFANRGNVLAAGGPEDLLYVGDEHRVQELKPDGTWVREIPLAGGGVAALAVDQTGDVYLAYEDRAHAQTAGAVVELAPNGQPLMEFPVAPSEPNASVEIGTLALDSSGHLAVTALEGGRGILSRWFGSLYDAGTSHRITEFSGAGPAGIAFSAGGDLYAAEAASAATGHEVLSYKPVPVGELLSAPAACKAGAEHETDVTFDCTLEGTVDAWGVKETEVWFQWGQTRALGSETPKQPIANLKLEGKEEAPVKALTNPPLAGLRPNETFYYQLAGEDHNVKAPELLTSERAQFDTPLVAPAIFGEPSVSFVKASSAVMFGELNPENAQSEYFFEYGAGETLAECPHGVRKESCKAVAATPAAQATCPVAGEGAGRVSRCVYAKTGVALQAGGLQPATAYRYRLSAESVNRAGTEKQVSAPGPEGSFTAGPAPVPQASTGAASALTATSATVSGSVNPDGLPATYVFELGVYNGADTQYGVVSSAPAGASTVPVEETLALTGLQPGTTYAFRIAISSGYVKNESHTVWGTPVTFTTAGLPEVLSVPAVLAQLAIPNISFPAAVASKSTTKALTNAQKLAKALKVCKKKSKSKRSACEKQARKKYPKSKQANHRKKR
jgi:hypothetical protein